MLGFLDYSAAVESSACADGSIEIRPGDVVWIPPGEKHWHGAARTIAMTHVAIQEQLDGKALLLDRNTSPTSNPTDDEQRTPHGRTSMSSSVPLPARSTAFELSHNACDSFGDVQEAPLCHTAEWRRFDNRRISDRIPNGCRIRQLDRARSKTRFVIRAD
jgi:hypothetical protein